MKWTQQIANFFTTSLQRKLMLAITMIVTLVMIAFGFYLINTQRQTATTELEGRATRTVDLLAQTISLPLWNVDKVSIQAQIDAVMADPEVNAVRVIETGKSEPTVQGRRETSAVEPIVRKAEIIFQRGEEKVSLGMIEIDYTREYLNRSLAQTTILIGIIVVALILLLLSSTYFLVGGLVTGPLREITTLASRVAGGDLTGRVNLTSRDEMNTLASAFNGMTSQLRQTLENLEQRVAARTKDLAIVAEVGAATATILETDKLLQAVVDITKERFELYHSHIYLLDQVGENLVLASGAGEPGRQMKAAGLTIPLNREQSLVARAARERQGVTVNDVTLAPDFLPNPLLPDTRSELAVPMIAGGIVIGVFDIQSDQVGRFADSDINIQTTLAAQVAISIQNVRSFEQSKSQADLESLVNTIGQKIQRATSVDDTLQTAIREIGLALGASRVSAKIGISRLHDGDETSLN
jgi:putative methionine-R-sulfoxide reductase with GAF domain